MEFFTKSALILSAAAPALMVNAALAEPSQELIDAAKAEENTPETLLAALKAGGFYSSQGPEFRHAELAGDEIRVETSAVASVIVQGQGSRAVAVHGNSMTRTTVLWDA